MTAREHSQNEPSNGRNSAEGTADETASTKEEPQPKKRARTTKGAARKSATPKTTRAKNAAKKKAPPTPSPTSRAQEPSEAEVRLRAYFIAERRVQLAQEGDPATDWLEAREQLLAEGRGARE